MTLPLIYWPDGFVTVISPEVDLATRDAQRKMTEAFINYEPVTISLTPQRIGVTAGGARTLIPGTPKPAQDFRLIFMGSVLNDRVTVTVDGVERVITYTLLGKWDADISVWDTWTGDDGTEYLVVALSEGFGYEKKGMVERHLPVS